MAILRRVPQIDRAVDELVAGGIGIVEVTLDTEDALRTIERLAGRTDVDVLAGTVRTAADVDVAIAAGAAACVGPAFVPEMVARCVELGVPAVPAALTPSEIEAAWRAGAEVVKLFPASAVGPGYLRAVLTPLGDVPILATGGVTAENAAEFLAAGAVAVGASIRTAKAARALAAAGRQ